MSFRTILSRIWCRLTGRPSDAALDARVDEEIAFHVDMATARALREGLAPPVAQRAALVAFGGRERWREATRDQYRHRRFEALLLDLRFAARTFRKAPVFTTAAVLTLSVGIGGTTAVFSAVDGALLRHLPFADAGQILTIWQQDVARATGRTAISPANFLDLRERSKSFSALAAAEPYSLDVDTPDGPVMVQNWNVTEGFFEALGVRPYLGHLFVGADFLPGHERTVVLSYEGWQRRFGGDAAVIGRRIRLERTPATIVGVLPPNAVYPDGREMWSPKVLTDEDRQVRESAFYQVLGRLKPDVTRQQAEAELRLIAGQLGAEYPKSNAATTLVALGLREALVGKVRTPLLILLGAVGMVLLVACANVASLFLGHATRRSHEFALRAALGAARGRIMRQLLAESLLLGALGVAGGIVTAFACLGVMRSRAPAELPQAAAMQVDLRALLFAAALGLVAAITFGMVPILRLGRSGPQEGLRTRGRTHTASRRRPFAGVVIAGEVALAVVLLIGSGLLVRSFMTLLRTDRGYQADHVLTATLFIWQWNDTEAQRAAFVRDLTARARTIPGVIDAGATSALPIPQRIGPTVGRVAIEAGPVTAPGDDPGVFVTVVTPELFHVLRTPLNHGRPFAAQDDATAPMVAIINQSFARRYFGDADPIGHRMTLRYAGPPVTREIIGVVSDVRESGLEGAPRPAVFIPHGQAPTGSVTLVVRTSGDPAATMPALRRTINGMNRELPIATSGTLEELLADSLRTRQFNLMLLGAFALTALILAIVGVGGVVAHLVTERRGEIGVRLALGAGANAVCFMVLRQGLQPVVAGVLMGGVAAAALMRLLQGMLFGVTAWDAIAYGGAITVMLATSALACLMPAWRAARVDPVVALRG